MAAGSTYSPIATTTLGSAAASYTFSSISGSYTDLVLVASGSNATGGTDNILLRFNSDTGSNYSRTRILGDGTSATSERVSNATGVAIGDWTTTQAMVRVNIQNYSNATTYKTTLARCDQAGFVSSYVGLWRNTAAITSVTFYVGTGVNISAGTTFTLYGISCA
jgi:hypothetical protein